MLFLLGLVTGVYPTADPVPVPAPTGEYTYRPNILPIPTGPSNKAIIDRAYMALGLSDSMFGRTQEEYASA